MSTRNRLPNESFLAVRFKRGKQVIVDAAKIDPADPDPIADAAALLVARHWRAGVAPRAGYPHDKTQVRRPRMEWCRVSVPGYIGSSLDAVAKAEKSCKWKPKAPVKINPAAVQQHNKEWDAGHRLGPAPSSRLAGAQARRSRRR